MALHVPDLFEGIKRPAATLTNMGRARLNAIPLHPFVHAPTAILDRWGGGLKMRNKLILGALALATVLLPVAALADDPHDPTMRTAAARARDHAIIKGLNQRELAYVRQRDARYAEGWRNYRSRGANSEDYARRRADYERANQRYAEDQSRYQRQLAAWRRAVAACRAGDYSACDH